MEIGYFIRTRYWQIYAFNNPPAGVNYQRAIDMPFYQLGIKNQFLLHTKWIMLFQECDLYHTYNSIVPGNKPWVVEVESYIPRYGRLKEGDQRFNWGLEKLKSDHCKAVIFTSEHTKEMNSENFEKWGINPDKCHVVYRAVETYDSLARTDKEKKFTILFVGNGFYRKGGVELIMAFKRFIQNDTRLVIVSNFDIDWEIFPTEEEVLFVKKEINKNPNIEVYKNLPHHDIVNLMRKSDVYVSTSYADPFNNSILEALACGIPSIGSNVRATPEFLIHGYNGFSIKPDKKDINKMVDFILNSLKRYYDDSQLLKSHGENAHSIINEKFLIKHRNKILKDIYEVG